MTSDAKSTKKTAGPLLRLIRQSGLYALGNVAVKATGLLLAPFYLNTAYLTVAGYGYFALLTVSAQLGIFVVGLGLGAGLLKHMADPDFAADRDALPFTALVSTVLAAVTAFVLLWLVAAPVARWLLDDPSRSTLVRLLAAYVALKVVGAIPLMMLRIGERAGLYAVAVTLEMLALVFAVYYFLAVARMGLEGIMLAFVISAGAATLVLVVVMLTRVPWTVRLRVVPPLVRYGYPLVMAGLAGWFLNAGDRYLLKWLSTPEVIAVYDWSSRVAGVLNMLFVQSFQLAFSVIGLKAAGLGEVDIHRVTFRHYVVWTGWAVVALSLFAYDLTHLLVVAFGVDGRYLGVETLAFPVTMGFLSYGLYVVVNNILYAAGRTRVIGVNVLVAAVLNAVLNLALIPWLGGVGAAVATFVAFTVLALATAYLAERTRHVGYPWRAALVVYVVCTTLYAIGHVTVAWGSVPRLGARLLLLGAYPLLVLASRAYSLDEVRRGWRQLRSRRPNS